jgi:hypothetical protein
MAPLTLPDVTLCAASSVNIEATLAACAALLDWLDATVPPSQSSDLISLNRLYYETTRSRFALPSQMITLCFRDWTRRRKGEAIEGVALMGLMAMPEVPPDQLPEAFARVRRLRDEIAPSWPMLSMGMSGDFAVAIAAGATHVRIGTRVFGHRNAAARAAPELG